MNRRLPDYDFYTGSYFGNQILACDFPRLISRAGTYLKDKVCADTEEQSYAMAACAVAEAWQENEQGQVVSESVATWSKHYAEKKPISEEQRLQNAARTHLGVCFRTVRWI